MGEHTNMLSPMIPVDTAKPPVHRRACETNYHRCRACWLSTCPVRREAEDAVCVLRNLAGICPGVEDAPTLGKALVKLSKTLKFNRYLPLPENVMCIARDMKDNVYKHDGATLEYVRNALYVACPCLRKPRKELLNSAWLADNRRAKRAQL